MKLGGILKLGIVLMLYAAAACVGLAFVYAGTSRTIEQRTQADLEAALKELFPGAESFKDISGAIKSGDEGVTFGGEYVISGKDGVMGAAVRASSGSYGGPITVLVGVNVNGTISRIKVLSHTDTPGLGANAANPKYYVNKAKKITFYDQFAGKSLGDPFTVKEDVAAITAATITSRAVTKAVKAAGDAAEKWLRAENGEVK